MTIFELFTNIMPFAPVAALVCAGAALKSPANRPQSKWPQIRSLQHLHAALSAGLVSRRSAYLLTGLASGVAHAWPTVAVVSANIASPDAAIYAGVVVMLLFTVGSGGYKAVRLPE